MKYITLYVMAVLLLPLKTYTQTITHINKPVTITVANDSLCNVFKAINKQTGVIFSYNPQLVNTTYKISVNVENKPLGSVLDDILTPLMISYKNQGKYIILTQMQLQPTITGNNTTISDSKEKDKLLIIKRDSISFQKITHFDSGNITLTCHRCIILKNGEMMRKQIVALALALATTTVSTAQVSDTIANNQSHNKRPAQLSFIYPLGSDKANSAQNTYGFSLNILGGITGGVDGAEFAGIFNINNYNTKGAQFAGIFNKTNNLNGVQFAGVANISQTANKSAQLSGVVNQVSSGNVAFQAAGVVNIADTATVQLSGLVNIAKKSNVQIGIINISDTANIMIGLVNIARNGFIEVEAAGGEFLHTTLSLRSGTKRFYGMVSIGGNFADEFWAYGGGIGTTFDFSKSWGLNTEAAVFTLVNRKFKHDDKGYNGLVQLRPVIYYQVKKHLKFFAGPVANFCVTDIRSEYNLNINAPYTIWDKTSGNKKYQAWIGFTAGVRF